MDQSKRRFVKMLPLAAVAVAGTVKMGAVQADAIEVSPQKKYVFRLRPVDGREWSQRDLERCAKTLRERGFRDPVIIQGDIDIFEVQ